jgi:cysteine desulfurase
MASISSSALRSVSRLGSSATVAAAPLQGIRRAALVAATRRSGRRGYVTESKRDHARVETAIKLDRKDFVDLPPPQLDPSSPNMKVSPMAGM